MAQSLEKLTLALTAIGGGIPWYRSTSSCGLRSLRAGVIRMRVKMSRAEAQKRNVERKDDSQSGAWRLRLNLAQQWQATR